MLCKFLFLDRRSCVIYRVRDASFYLPICLMAFPETLDPALVVEAVEVAPVEVVAVTVIP